MLKNIIIVYDQAYYSGGAAKIAIESAIELSKNYNVYFFCGIERVDDRLKKSDVQVISCNQEHIGETKKIGSLIRGIWNYNVYKKFKMFLSKFDTNDTIIHIHGWTKALSCSIFDAIREMKFKMIVTLHEFFCVCENGGLYDFKKNRICDLDSTRWKCKFTNCDKKNYFYKIYRNVREIIQHRSLKKSKPSVIYISSFSQNIIDKKLSFFPKHKYFVENFIEFNKINRKRVKAEKNNKYLFLARLSHEKGLDLFCDAITKTNVKGIVLGSGPLLKKYSEKYPNIEFLGWVQGDNKDKILEEVRCIIISSRWYETMGLTALEMKSIGIPAIIADQSATKEYIIDEQEGLLFSIEKDNLCDKIEILKDDDVVRRMSEKCFSSFETNKYSIESHTKKLLEVYEREMKC